MAGSALGTILRVTTWGESHGKGIGVVVDGCPAGLPLEEGDIQSYLNRRKPGQSKFTTARQEGDQVEILSGVFGGRTTGTPIALEVRGFGAGKKKTWLTERTRHKGDREITIFLGVCILAAVVWRIVGCL